MRSAILTALMVVLVGGAAGVVANVTYYKLPWLRERSTRADSPSLPPPAHGNSEQGSQSSGTDSEPSSRAAEPAANPCAPRPGDKPMTVRMECVLEYLEKGGAYIVDAREQHDFDEGRLRGAFHLPSSAIYANIQGFMATGAQVDDVIIVYCGGGSCEASHNVADVLHDDFQYQKVFVYEAGWEEIERSGRFGDYVESGGAQS
ncbi:MAG: rhodanese-like domain-containing protein [Phycisphaerae bacterium]|nr:rhodanese-like domain-containing protein [Phycisphaerae bacterium]